MLLSVEILLEEWLPRLMRPGSRFPSRGSADCMEKGLGFEELRAQRVLKGLWVWDPKR